MSFNVSRGTMKRMTPLPERLEIKTLDHPPEVSVHVPGSKSITNRALVLAALITGSIDCTLQGALRSEDTEFMIEGLRALGFKVSADWSEHRITIDHEDGLLIPLAEANVCVGNS